MRLAINRAVNVALMAPGVARAPSADHVRRPRRWKTLRTLYPGRIENRARTARGRAGTADVPAATPIPRGPSVPTLYDAADLLTDRGCPVCRYTAERADHYLAWFALEGHAQAATVTRLSQSLGMCPQHTRGLVSQPGAAVRLTADWLGRQPGLPAVLAATTTTAR
jgi:hypothetical protein